MIFHKKPPQPPPTPGRYEFFTNLAAQGEFLNGHVLENKSGGCPLKNSAPKKEVQNMTDKVSTIKSEIADLKSEIRKESVKYVQQSVDHQRRLAEAREAGEAIQLNKDMARWGLHFL